MTRKEAQENLVDLRAWAKAEFGEEPFNPTEPEVGGEILRFGFDQNPDEGERYIYTQEMFEEDVKKRPWNYKPRWIYELQDMVENDEA